MPACGIGVWCADVGQPGGGGFPVEPFPQRGDERIGAITIDELIGSGAIVWPVKVALPLQEG